MDLDDDELEATKIINKTIDVNKDIALLEEFADLCKRGFNKENQVKEGYAIKRVIKKLENLEIEIRKEIETTKEYITYGNTAFEYTQKEVYEIVLERLESLLEVK